MGAGLAHRVGMTHTVVGKDCDRGLARAPVSSGGSKERGCLMEAEGCGEVLGGLALEHPKANLAFYRGEGVWVGR